MTVRDNDYTTILENIPGTTEYKLRKLEEDLQLPNSLLLNERVPVPECRVMNQLNKSPSCF